jgi:hypothetical protein
MDAELGRQQTTQGVWMGVAQVDTPEIILVMDVEGTDGRERGEEEVAFERKTSLFSLAIASVLIINMWMQDIGRYQAANIGLLKTVFELNLQLFQHASNSKTLILFVIRDHVTTPISKLQTIVLKDMEGVWQSLTKPHQFEDSRVTDFFDFTFATLAHKELAADQFVTQALALRDRFTNPNNPEFLLKREYNKGIPADGLAAYSYSIWDTIKANKDLDIPSQKEMLATYRCEELMQNALDQFEAELKPIREKVERGEIVEKYGPKAFRMLENATNSYNNIANRYHPDVSARKYATLRQRSLTELESVFDKLVERLRAKALEFFRSLVTESFAEQSHGRVTLQFASLMDSITVSALKFFEDAASDSALPAAASVTWSWETPLAELQNAIAADIERMKKEHLALILSEAKAALENSLTPTLSHILENAKSTSAMWASVRNALESAVQAGESDLKPNLIDLSLSDELLRKHLDAIRTHGPVIVRKSVRDAGQHLSLMMQKRFDESFNFDEHKLPRRWSRRDDIPKLFKYARQKAEGLTEQFSMLRLNAEDDSIVCCPITDTEDPNPPADLIHDNDPRLVLTRKERTTILERFRESTNASFKSAMQEQEAAKAAGTNPLLWVLILVLGWNEMVTLLSYILGPLLLPLLLIAGVLGYLIWKGQLGGPAFQVMQSIGLASVRQVWSQVQSLMGSRGQEHPKKD